MSSLPHCRLKRFSNHNPFLNQFLSRHHVTSTIIAMFNVDITGSFSGAHPRTLLIPSHLYNSAVSFYKSKLKARDVSRGAGSSSRSGSSSRTSVTLESSYGFRFKVEKISSNYSTGGNVRLSLNPSVDKSKVARALANGKKVSQTRSGLVTTDPFGVTWTIV